MIGRSIDMTELEEQQWSKKVKYYHPYLYHFEKIKWFIFGTLTWNRESRRKDTYLAERNRRADFNQLIKQFRIKFHIGRKKLCYYRATEKTGNAHFHFLIAAQGVEHLDPIECSAFLTKLWKHDLRAFGAYSKGIGQQVDIRPYDQAENHPAYEYVTKREFKNGIELERDDDPSDGLKKLIKQMNETPTVDSLLPLIQVAPNETEDDFLI
jgi:hypothetical protein